MQVFIAKNIFNKYTERNTAIISPQWEQCFWIKETASAGFLYLNGCRVLFIIYWQLCPVEPALRNRHRLRFPFLLRVKKRGAFLIYMHLTSTTDVHNDTNARMHHAYCMAQKLRFRCVSGFFYKVVGCGASQNFYTI